MRKEDKIKKLVLGENKFNKLKENKENILITKEEAEKIKQLTEAAKYWDNFNFDLYLKRFQND
tara:strand:+ start:264 stop:452 length:189 start_codon:yes stop_codon:yes gene_type:complete